QYHCRMPAKCIEKREIIRQLIKPRIPPGENMVVVRPQEGHQALPRQASTIPSPTVSNRGNAVARKLNRGNQLDGRDPRTKKQATGKVSQHAGFSHARIDKTEAE